MMAEGGTSFGATAGALVAWVSRSVHACQICLSCPCPLPLIPSTPDTTSPPQSQANTFEHQGGPVTTSLAELSDGVRVAEILHDMYVGI